MSGDLSETDISNEPRHPQAGVATTEEKLRNRLYELAMKMSEKETSSGEDQESEPKTESENHKESLSSEENSQGVQEELKKVSAVKPPAGSSVWAAGEGGGRGSSVFAQRCAGPPMSCLSNAHPVHAGEPQKPCWLVLSGSVRERAPRVPGLLRPVLSFY